MCLGELHLAKPPPVLPLQAGNINPYILWCLTGSTDPVSPAASQWNFMPPISKCRCVIQGNSWCCPLPERGKMIKHYLSSGFIQVQTWKQSMFVIFHPKCTLFRQLNLGYKLTIQPVSIQGRPPSLPVWRMLAPWPAGTEESSSADSSYDRSRDKYCEIDQEFQRLRVHLDCRKKQCG